jgi:predicted nucleotidyltransferase
MTPKRWNTGGILHTKSGWNIYIVFDTWPMAIRLEEEFQELLRSLNRNDVRYLLIGGYAVILNGYVRNTTDLDLAIASDAENAENVVKALKEFGFDVPGLDTGLFTKPKSLVRMGFEPLKVEIINYLEGVGFENAYRNRNVIELDGLEISLIAIGDLIANKKAVGRHIDLADVEKLEKINK